MINSLLIIAGILLLVFAIIQCVKLIKINTIQYLQWSWYLMLCLIIFFLVGYISYYFLNIYSSNIPVSSLLISSILFFGAIFVIGVLSISYKLVKALTQKNTEMQKMNKALSEKSEKLIHKQEELDKTQKLLLEKNTELENTLEDFYTMRLGIQEDMKLGRIEEENKKIKERLDKLKTQ